MTEETSTFHQLEQKFLNLRDADGSVCFESIDLEVAVTAAHFLPNNLSEDQIALAFLLFCACHKHTRNGHILFQPESLSSVMPGEIIAPPSKMEVEKLFASLDINFHHSNANPIFWEAGDLLYIRQLYTTERETARNIVKRATTHPNAIPSVPIDLPPLPDTLTESQREAVLSPIRKRLTLISGGPGTGKTYTVFQAIRVILHTNPDASIQLLAPTGKAVARIQESIRGGLTDANLSDQHLKQIQASTIHRFLNQQQRHKSSYQPYPKPIPPIDYVIVDEASMIDLQLLNRLLETLELDTHLVMMGDISQLASVQPGAAFADVFESCRQLVDRHASTLELKNPFRFKHAPELAKLCDFIRVGDSKSTMASLSNTNQSNELRWIRTNTPELVNTELNHWMTRHLIPVLGETSPEKAMTAYQNSMILCVQNEGPFGVNTLNRTFSKVAAHHRFLLAGEEAPVHFWKPVMVRNNDYRLKLFNGDFGVIQQSATNLNLENPIACFQSVEGSYLLHPEHLLPDYSEAFAITVHKSQGSEADHVLLILPDVDSPLLTRELFYTAASRARRSLTIIGLPEIIRACLNRPTRRESRLRERILKLSQGATD